ncbi:MAG: STM3941 family protein [Campylobacteraceae bacterium]
MERVVIPLRDKKIYIGLVVAVLFLVLSGYMFQTKESPAFNMSPMLVKTASALSFMFFAVIAYFLVQTIIKGRDAFLAGPKGIYDSSSGLALGFVPWEDIKSVEVRSFDKIDYLLIDLNDVKKYKSNENEYFARIIDMNMNYYKAPIAISSKKLKCNIKDLAAFLQDLHKQSLHVKEDLNG